MIGGVPVLEGGLLGRLIVGLSHDEKKSSVGSSAGMEVPSDVMVVRSSVMTTSSGWLESSQPLPGWDQRASLLLAVSFSSTLQLVFVLGSCI